MALVLTFTRVRRAWAAAACHPQVVDALLGAVIGAATLLAVLEGPPDNPGRAVARITAPFRPRISATRPSGA